MTNTYSVQKEFDGEYGREFIEVKIRFVHYVSITATAGSVVSEVDAKQYAFDSVYNLINECSDTYKACAQAYGETDEEVLAQCEIDAGGWESQLAIHDQDGDKVYLAHSWGCQHDEIREHFSELAPVIEAHLTQLEDLKPGELEQLKKLCEKTCNQ